MKTVIIENKSSLSYSQIGYILDNQKSILTHIDENIYYENDNGIQFVFNVKVEDTSDHTKWTFRNVGC